MIKKKDKEAIARYRKKIEFSESSNGRINPFQTAADKQADIDRTIKDFS